MKNTYKLLIISTLSAFSCQKDVKDLIDKTASLELAPTYTVDSPMWKQLASPAYKPFLSATSGIYKTEDENLFTAAMIRRTLQNDNEKIDNLSQIFIIGNIDNETRLTGEYFSVGNYWAVTKRNVIARYEPVVLGPMRVGSGNGAFSFVTIVGGGYATGDYYPNGVKFYQDNWMRTDFNQSGDIVKDTVLTGFTANNTGFFIENDNKKQFWKINNIQVYDKLKPFYGNLYGKFLMTSAKINNKGYGFLLSESKDEKVKTKEFYQYDTDTDTWTRKADFVGEDRQEGVLFGIDDKVYYGLGQSKTDAKGFRDIWQYDTQTDKWSNFATYPGSGNIKVATAQVAGKVYIGMGYYVGATSINTEKYIGTSDFWEFVPSRK